ncbi:haptoglobin [Sardina pilchardus]|uniref:haptoglobin n=1 Tax=Sardina pilchardus TaxID=27697 RepID=UPI002E1091E3
MDAQASGFTAPPIQGSFEVLKVQGTETGADPDPGLGNSAQTFSGRQQSGNSSLQKSQQPVSIKMTQAAHIDNNPTDGEGKKPLYTLCKTSIMMRLSVGALLALVACLPHTGAQHEDSEVSAHRRPRRMIGGLLADSVPWHVMVYLGEGVFDGGFAGGALISDRWVLTAGRNLFIRRSRDATQGKQPLIPKIYMGITNRANADASTEAAVDKVFLHPGFQNTSDWDNDLALIRLKSPVTFSQSVMPIPLPERGDDLEETPGTLGLVAGWGWGRDFVQSKFLKFLKLPVVSCQSDDQVMSGTPVVDDNMLCTGPGEYEANVCFWDAGSALPVLSPGHNRVYAAGILSYDKGCNVKSYAVYTKISPYLPWIHEVMRGDKDYASQRFSALARMFSRKF